MTTSTGPQQAQPTTRQALPVEGCRGAWPGRGRRSSQQPGRPLPGHLPAASGASCGYTTGACVGCNVHAAVRRGAASLCKLANATPASFPQAPPLPAVRALLGQLSFLRRRPRRTAPRASGNSAPLGRIHHTAPLCLQPHPPLATIGERLRSAGVKAATKQFFVECPEIVVLLQHLGEPRCGLAD